MKIITATFSEKEVRAVVTNIGTFFVFADCCRALGYAPSSVTALADKLQPNLINKLPIAGTSVYVISGQGLEDFLRHARRNGRAHRVASFQHFLANALHPATSGEGKAVPERPQTLSQGTTQDSNKAVIQLLLKNTLSATDGLVRANIQMALDLLKD